VIAEDDGRLVRPVPVAGHQLGGADGDLADLFHRNLAQALVIVEDRDGDIRQRHADRPDLVRPFRGVDAQRHHRLGQRVAFDDAGAGERFEAGLGLGEQRRGAGKADTDRLEVDLALLDERVVEHRDVQRRHAVEERRLDAADVGEEVAEIAWVGHEGDRAADDERQRLHADVAVDMEHRQRQEGDRGRAAQRRCVPGFDLQPSHDVGAVSTEHAFGCAGRAAAHQEHCGIRRPGGRGRRLPAAVDEQQVGEVVIAGLQRDAIAVARFAKQREEHAQQRRKVLLDVGRDDPPHSGLRLHILDPLIEARQREHGLDPVVAQRTFELVLGVDRVQRRDDRPDLPGAELGDEELRAVGQQQADTIAACDPDRRERGSARVAQTIELAV
jgi:hypothetical protein